ncbi:MAG: DUF5309 domain-containing protein [Candidatus Dojkabacteria bacterium]|nr:DUF5309 domain-containing protein [Candidatus Dojkabacteria bacterium]
MKLKFLNSNRLEIFKSSIFKIPLIIFLILIFNLNFMSNYTNFTFGNVLKESLKDVLTMMGPDDTPLVSSLPVSPNKPEQFIHEFVRYEISRPTTNGAIINGADLTFPDASNAVRDVNYVQEIAEPIKVSYTQIASSSATPKGASDTLATAKMNAAIVWKLKLERSLLLNTGQTGSSTQATEMKGLINGAGVVHHSLNINGTLTETKLNEAMQLIWENVNPTVADEIMAFLDPAVKAFISRNYLSSIQRNVEESKEKRLFTNVIAYSSDFGTVQLIAHKDLKNTGRGVIIAKNSYMIAYMQKPRYEELAKTGPADKGMIYGAATLEFLYPKSGVKLNNIST